MAKININVSNAAYDWFDQVANNSGISVNVYLSHLIENRYKEATAGAQEGGFIYARNENNQSCSG